VYAESSWSLDAKLADVTILAYLLFSVPSSQVVFEAIDKARATLRGLSEAG